MKNNIFVVPIGNRYYLKDKDGRVFGRKDGFKTKEAAASYLNWFVNFLYR